MDRIYSEYVQVTLKAAEAEAAKSTKMDQAMGNPEKVKRKYKKRIKENQSAQSSGMSLLKPLGQLSTGTTVKIVFKYLLYYFHCNVCLIFNWYKSRFLSYSKSFVSNNQLDKMIKLKYLRLHIFHRIIFIHLILFIKFVILICKSTFYCRCIRKAKNQVTVGWFQSRLRSRPV